MTIARVPKRNRFDSETRRALNDIHDALNSSLGVEGVTASAAELNILDGVTASTAELNILDGVTATAAELNYLDITTLGTGAPSKAVVLDANSDWEAPVNSVIKYFQLKDADDTLLTATMEYINQQCDYTGQVMTAGAGFAGAGTLYKVGVRNTGTMKKTEIMIDLTDAKSTATDLDIIGNSGVSHIGQITAALNGTALMGKMTCLEVPVGGAVDIDLYAATEGTGAYDGLVTDLAETALVTAGGNWTLGLEKTLAALPAANQYLYLTSGAATAGTYSAGKFLIEIWGY